MSYVRTLLVVIAALVIAAPTNAAPVILFDNGPVDATRTTWSDNGSYAIVDDFVLASANTVTSLVYHIFAHSPLAYTGTNVSLFSGPINNSGTTGALITAFAAVGATASNGLHTTNPGVPDGYDVTISGLSINLGPGIYSLELYTMGAPASIGSGPGSGQTLGLGLFQVGPDGGFRSGDNMAFTVIGNSVPEPATLALLGLGLAGLGFFRRKV